MNLRPKGNIINFRVTPEERLLIAQLAERLALTQTAVFKALVRRAASDVGLVAMAPPQQSIDERRDS
jgi:hypothetical protein